MSYKARKRKMIERAQKEAQKQRIPAPTQPPADMREIRLSRKSPGVIVDSYVPVPKELLPPIYTRAGITSRWERLKKSIRSTLSVGLVRRHVAWQPIPFAQDAQEKLIRAQIALSRGDKETMRELLTDDANMALRQQFRMRHKWEFVKELERPRVVHVTSFPVEDKANIWAQVTVRVHLRQILALYNNAGGIVKGSETDPVDVVEYIVLERHVVNKDAKDWKIAGKLPGHTQLQ